MLMADRMSLAPPASEDSRVVSVMLPVSPRVSGDFQPRVNP